MSLYNMVMGVNPHAKELKKILGLSFLKDNMYRFRDIWLSEDGKEISLLARLGSKSIRNLNKSIAIIRGNPFYLRETYDDDETYMIFVFSTPVRMIERAKEMVETGGYMDNPLQVYSKAIKKVKEGKVDGEYAQNIMNACRTIGPALNLVLDNKSKEEKVSYGAGCIIIKQLDASHQEGLDLGALGVSILDEDAV